MNRLLIAFLTLAFFSNTNLSAMDLSIEINAHRIRFTLKNDSSELVRIDKRLALGSDVGWSELLLTITNSDGRKFPFSKKIQLGAPTEADVCSLKPNEFVGRDYTLDEIMRFYELPPGEYEILARYRGKARGEEFFSGTVESPKLKLFLSATPRQDH